MRTLTISTIAFVLLTATASTLHANGMMGSSPSAPAASKPAGKSQQGASGGGQCQTARTNCHGFAGPQVNPGRDFPQWRPGYVSGSEVIKGVRGGPPMNVPPGSRIDTSGYTRPHLGTVPGAGGPDHSFVIYPGGKVAQRFDTDPGRYGGTFPNLTTFRNQEFPIGTGRHPFTGTVFQVYCPAGCTQRH